MFSWKPLAGALALASTLCFPSHAQNDTVQQMQALVLANQHNRAFELGEQHIEEAGLPGFDFYYGIAAIEAGSPSAGVFALERYITAYPDNRTARFYLARGFFILGEDQLARAEFEDLLNNANDAENAVIQQYLDAIWERENRHYPRLRLVAEVGLGHDSNVNEGVAVGPVAGLLFPLSVSQNDSNRQVGDTVALSNIGIEGSRPIAPGLTWQGHAKAGLYAPLDRTQFDQRHLAAGTALAWEQGRHWWRTGLAYRADWTDGQHLLDTTSWYADWHYRQDQFHRWGAAVSWARLNYRNVDLFDTLDRSGPRVTSSDDQRDSDLWQLSAHHTRYYSHPWAPAWKNTLLVGQERNRQARPDLSRHFWGLQSSWTARPADRWLTQLQLTYMSSRYRDIYQVFGFPLGTDRRRDDRWQASALASYRWSRHWHLVAEWSVLHQSSHIGYHAFDRQRWLFKAQYEFK